MIFLEIFIPIEYTNCYLLNSLLVTKWYVVLFIIFTASRKLLLEERKLFVEVSFLKNKINKRSSNTVVPWDPAGVLALHIQHPEDIL